MNPVTLTLPVPYTLKMRGNGTFIAKWQPEIATPGLPVFVVGESATSGLLAIERLYEALYEKGVLAPPQSN